MKSIVLKFSEIDTKDRLTVDHYLSEDLITIKELEKSPYSLVYLGDLATIKGGKRLPPKARYSASGIPYIRVVDVGNYEIKLDDVVYISEELHQKINRYQLRKDDIGIVIVGATIGKTAILKSSVSPCNFNENLARITVQHQKLSPDFLLAYLQSPFGQAYISWLTGGSAQAKLSLERIAKIRVPVPPRSLQDQIAQVMQEAYGDRQKKLEESETSFLGIAAYIHEVLEITRNFPIDEPRFLVNQSQLHRWDVRFFLPSFSHLEDFIEKGKYPTKPLLAVGEKITNGLTPAKIGYTDEGCVVVKVASLTKLFQINWDKVAFTSNEFFKKAKKAYIKDGDLLVLSASHQLDYIGRSFALVRDIPTDYVNQCMAVGELILIRSNPQLVLPEYLLTCFMMQPIQKLINRMTRGQSAHLYAEDLQYLKIPVPPLDVQQTIIDEMDRRRSEVKRLRSQAEAVVAAAKARVERMILGEEEIGEN